MDKKYKNLPEENRNYLISICDKITKEQNYTIESLPNLEKARKTYSSKIMKSLLYGMEEIKVNMNNDAFWKKFVNSIELENIKKMIKDKTDSEKIDYCEDISIEIESYIFLMNKEKITTAYNTKIFDIFRNLNMEGNGILRAKIILKIITPEVLYKMDNEELMPPDQKEKIIKEKEKMYKEQVFITGDNKIVAFNIKDLSSNTLVNKTEKKLDTNDYEIYKDKEEQDKKFLGKKTLEKKSSIDTSYNIGNNKTNENNRKASNNNKELSPQNTNNKSIVKKQDSIDNLKLGKKESIKGKINNNILIDNSKYDGLSSDLLRFYFELDQFSIDNLKKKINEKITTNLKESTVNEIKELRKKYNVDI